MRNFSPKIQCFAKTRLGIFSNKNSEQMRVYSIKFRSLHFSSAIIGQNILIARIFLIAVIKTRNHNCKTLVQSTPGANTMKANERKLCGISSTDQATQSRKEFQY